MSGTPLNQDIMLDILAHLDVTDVLSMRQVCKSLRDLTRERAVWVWRYAGMVRERRLPTPMTDPTLSTSNMESAVRRNALVDSAWRRATPKMESLRPITLTVDQHSWVANLARLFMVPGGQYVLLFTTREAYILSFNEPSPTPALFISLENIEGMGPSTCAWTTGRPDDGSVTLFASFLNSDGVFGFAFWSADFRSFPPTRIYHGQLSIPHWPFDARTKNELFMYNREGGQYIIILDWKALARRLPFRYYALRFGCQLSSDWIPSLHDFCLLPNGCILVIDSFLYSLHLFAPPTFETVVDLNQPLPTEFATPIWQYQHASIGSHICSPSSVWPLPQCHQQTNAYESTALVHSRSRNCYYLVSLAPGEPRILGHRMLARGSRFIPGRTRAVEIALNGREGYRIGCLSYPTTPEGEIPTASFNIAKQQSQLLNIPRVYFDEESGRMCFWPLVNPTHILRDQVILVLDMI